MVEANKTKQRRVPRQSTTDANLVATIKQDKYAVDVSGITGTTGIEDLSTKSSNAMQNASVKKFSPNKKRPTNQLSANIIGPYNLSEASMGGLESIREPPVNRDE